MAFNNSIFIVFLFCPLSREGLRFSGAYESAIPGRTDWIKVRVTRPLRLILFSED